MHSKERRVECGRFERRLLWPAILGLSTVAAWAVTIVHTQSLLPDAVVGWFLVICPGMAVVRVLRLYDALSEWVLAVALSITIDAILAIAQLYGAWWSSTDGLIALSIITLAASALSVAWPNEAGERVSTNTRAAKAPVPDLARRDASLQLRRKHVRQVAVQRQARINVQSSRRWRTTLPISRHWDILGALLALTVPLLIGVGTEMVTQLPVAQTLVDLQAGLSAFVGVVSGDQSRVVGTTLALLLGTLLIERELERATGRTIPGAWSGRRNVAIALLVVVFATVIGLRFACLAGSLFCLGGPSLP